MQAELNITLNTCMHVTMLMHTHKHSCMYTCTHVCMVKQIACTHTHTHSFNDSSTCYELPLKMWLLVARPTALSFQNPHHVPDYSLNTQYHSLFYETKSNVKYLGCSF